MLTREDVIGPDDDIEVRPVISGGEPFYMEGIFEIFKKHSDMAFLVFTHGGLIDEKMVEKLTEVGNVMPSFSLEGYEQETDERRGADHTQP